MAIKTFKFFSLFKTKIAFILILLILASLFLRFYNLGERPFWEDEALYSGISSDILQGDFNAPGVLPIYPPSFFYLNAISQLIFGNTEFGNRFFSALFGSLSILLIFFIGKKLFNKTTGIFAAILLAFSPEHIIFSREALPFAVGIFFFLLTFYTLLGYFQNPKAKQNKLFFLSGLAIFVSFLFHFIISAFFILLIPAMARIYRKKISRRSIILTTLALALFSYYVARILSSFYFSNLLDYFPAESGVISYLQSIIATITKHHVKSVIALIYENYLDAKYLFIPPLLLASLLLSPKKMREYKKSLFLLSLVFVLIFLLILRTANTLEIFNSGPSRLHILLSPFVYLAVGFSLFLLYNKHKKVALAFLATLVILFLFHTVPILEKKIVSVSEDFSLVHLVETKSIVCSRDYYLPLTLDKFINAFLFCFPHHPVYYDDTMDWKGATKIIENTREKNTESITIFTFSSYPSITSFYLQQAKIDTGTLYEDGAVYEGGAVYKKRKVFYHYYDLQCNGHLLFCPQNEKLDIFLELADIEKRRRAGENIEVFFIIDVGRYDWILQSEEKKFLDSECVKYESDFMLYQC